MRRLQLLATSAVVFLAATPSMSAEVSIKEIELKGRDKGQYHNEIIVLQLDGPITDGDSNQLRSILRETVPEYAPNALSQITIQLNSTGGSFSEGVTLMKVFKELAIGTVVGSEQVCHSACAVAFLGGTLVNDASIFYRSRIVEPGGRLGFHAPSLSVSGDTLVPIEMLQSSYESALSALGQLIEASKEFSIDTSLLETITSTPPSDMYEVKYVDDFARWKIDVSFADFERAEGQSWKPDNTDIARMCMNYPVWLSGKSVSENIARIRGEYGDYDRGKAIEELAQNISIRQYSAGILNKEYAVIQTLEFEYDEYCIVELTELNGAWIITIHQTTSDPDIAIEALQTSNFGLQSAYRLHALPADFNLAELTR